MTTTRPRPTPHAALALQALLPASAALGAPSFTLHVMGTGFTATDVIMWNGAPEPTTFVSDTEVTTGVNMDTAINTGEIPVRVDTAGGAQSNSLVFTFRAAGTEPPLPEVEPPTGFALVMDSEGRPVLILAEEVVVIEDAISPSDPTGPLYHQQPASAYRRLTLRSGYQVYLSTGSLSPLLAALSA